VNPFETYKTFIGMKSHFIREKYDYARYGNKLSKLTVQGFYKRRDRQFFERMSRKYNDQEIQDFFIANFATDEDPSTVYMPNIIKNGDKTYTDWKKRIQSLTYTFIEESHKLFDNQKVDDIFDCSKGHPPILKSYLRGDTSLESMVIYDRILGYRSNFDKQISKHDPVWGMVSMKIRKYTPFLNIDVFRYKKILKDIVSQ
tara:strand:- start:1181 stop:1780 length:600 start_codon:yes stop_codon:yes gene_type:complete